MDKTTFPTKLLWVDLEMTGLDVEQDVIIEVAAEITDFDGTVLARYEACVGQSRDVVVERLHANSWYDQFPANRDTFINDLDKATPSVQVERDLCALIKQHFGDEPAILAGNSIHNDRNFIKRWWPQLDSCLHYRMLDVSSLKIVMQGKYGVEFEKKKSHRALDDIHESITELDYYLEYLRHGS